MTDAADQDSIKTANQQRSHHIDARITSNHANPIDPEYTHSEFKKKTVPLSDKQQKSVRIAHLSDPHLPIPTRPTIEQLFSKRMLGFVNWTRRRQYIHRKDVLDLLVADVRDQDPDHILIGGDLVNLALPAEFDAARVWLHSVGPAENVMVVPGNHDTYVPVPYEEGLGKWSAYMRGDHSTEREPSSATGVIEFPTVRDIGCVRIIGLNSSPSTLPGLATGAIDDDQLRRLRAVLGVHSSGSQKKFTIILLHHPIVAGIVKSHKALQGADELARVLSDAKVDLILHGHAHIPVHRMVGKANIPHIGVASASYCEAQHNNNTKRAAGQYHLFTISRISNAPEEFDVSLNVRAVDPERGEVIDLGKTIAFS